MTDVNDSQCLVLSDWYLTQDAHLAKMVSCILETHPIELDADWEIGGRIYNHNEISDTEEIQFAITKFEVIHGDELQNCVTICGKIDGLRERFRTSVDTIVDQLLAKGSMCHKNLVLRFCALINAYFRVTTATGKTYLLEGLSINKLFLLKLIEATKQNQPVISIAV